MTNAEWVIVIFALIILFFGGATWTIEAFFDWRDARRKRKAEKSETCLKRRYNYATLRKRRVVNG